MAVISTTLAGVNVWQFSGAVTDAQINTAWAGVIVNGVYVINRAIYLDNTADISGVTGGFMVDFGTQVLPAIILDTRRDNTKSTFNNFIFVQRTGLTLTQRVGFVQTWNGSNFANQGAGLGIDGLNLNGGAFVYAVAGNSGVGDSRYLNEMPFTGLEGVTVMSQEFTEQELQVVVASTTKLKGIKFEKAYGFPQIGTPVASVNVTVYRSTQNTQSLSGGGLIPVRLYPSNGRYASVCYVDSYVTRNNSDITARLIDGFGTNASNIATIMILNNFTRGSWFGTAKTNMAVTTWSATNVILGGVLKKLQFIGGDSGVVRCYDSRSEITSQKCAFQETGSIDFLSTNIAPATDSQGRISLVHIGAIATGSNLAPITRYNNQKYTFQKFGFRIIVATPDMSAGDNDLSAFTPVTLTVQNGIIRTQAEIQSATTITTFREVLEELHNLAIGLVGSASYNAFNNGNLFEFTGTELITNFATVNINKNAVPKIDYNATTNTLTLKSNVLTGENILWKNPTGTINTLNGSLLQGNIEDLNGDSSVKIQGGSGNFTLWKLPDTTNEDDYATGVNLGNCGNATIRFLSEVGFKIIIRDNTTSFRQVQPMVKGIYTIGMYFGDQIQLAQNSEITYIKNKIDGLENYDDSSLQTKFDAVKTVVDGLENYDDSSLQTKVDAVKTVVDGLENYDDSSLQNKVDAVKTVVDGLENYDDSSLQTKVDAVKTVVDGLENYDDSSLQTKVDAVKTVVDGLENYDDSSLQTKVDAIKAVVDSVKTTVEDLENFDASQLIEKVDTISPKLSQINEGLKLLSNFEPYEGELP